MYLVVSNYDRDKIKWVQKYYRMYHKRIIDDVNFVNLN